MGKECAALDQEARKCGVRVKTAESTEILDMEPKIDMWSLVGEEAGFFASLTFAVAAGKEHVDVLGNYFVAQARLVAVHEVFEQRCIPCKGVCRILDHRFSGSWCCKHALVFHLGR